MSYQRNYYGNLKYDENTDTYTSYSVYYNVLAVDKSTFNDNTTIVSVDFNDLPFVDDDMSSAFSGCISLQQVLNLSDSVTNMTNTFAGCKFTAVPISSIPETVVNMTGTFSGCDNLITAPIIPNNVESLELTFSNCTDLTGDINIRSAKISNATNCFSGTTNSKNVYIPFKDSSNNNTTTYNSFIAAGYNTSGTTNGVYLKDNSSISLSFVKLSTVASYEIDGTTYTSSRSIPLDQNIEHLIIATPSSSVSGPNYELYINSDLGSSLDGVAKANFIISNGSVTFTGKYQNQSSIPISYTASTSISLQLGVGSYNCCVPYYTEIIYSDNTTKTAENVHVGDKLLGYNEITGEFDEVEVLDVIHKLRNELVTVKTENYEIEITPDHPILTDQGWAVYNLEASNYIDVNKIQLTDDLKVLTVTGYEDISSIEYRTLETPMDTYTFNVSDDVDTYVTAGLVSHNTPC